MILLCILCLLAGATIGMFISALMATSGYEDRCVECEYNKKEDEE